MSTRERVPNNTFTSASSYTLPGSGGVLSRQEIRPTFYVRLLAFGVDGPPVIHAAACCVLQRRLSGVPSSAFGRVSQCETHPVEARGLDRLRPN